MTVLVAEPQAAARDCKSCRCCRLRLRNQRPESRRPAPARILPGAASSPDRRPAGSSSCPASSSPALPAAASATPPAGSATAPASGDWSRGPAPAVRETPAPTSAPPRSPRSAPHAVPVRGGRRQPVRHKRAARYFVSPIRTSYSFPLHPRCVIPKSRAFTSGARDLARSATIKNHSSHIPERSPQFLRGPEQRILRRLFRRMQNLTHRAQLQSVIMLQFEHHALPGRKLFERSRNPRAQLPPHQIALRIRPRPPIGHLIKQIVLAAVGIFRHRRIFLAHVSLAQVIQTQVRDDPVNPGIKGTLKQEAADVLVRLQERILINILGVVFGAGEMQSEPQHGLVVVTDEFLEGGSIPLLRLADQHRVINATILYLATLPSHAAPRGVLLTDYASADSLRPLTLKPRVGDRTSMSANRK